MVVRHFDLDVFYIVTEVFDFPLTFHERIIKVLTVFLLKTCNAGFKIAVLFFDLLNITS